MIIIHDGMKNGNHTEVNNNNQVACQIYEMNMNVSAKAMIDWLCTSLGPINKNLTAFLQRYGVFGCERTTKCLVFKINNIVMPMIPREHNFDSHRRTGETWRARAAVRIWVAPRRFVAGISFPWRGRTRGGERIHILNMTWIMMKRMDKCLISLVPAEDMGN
jgi:hypothetical protein